MSGSWFGGEEQDPEVDKGSQAVAAGTTVRNSDFAGFLTKQSMWLKEWRRRYFLLKHDKLFFAEQAESEPHGVIDLADCTSVKSAEANTNKRYGFELVTSETTFCMYADSEDEKDEWICALTRAVVRFSDSYQEGSSAYD